MIPADRRYPIRAANFTWSMLVLIAAVYCAVHPPQVDFPRPLLLSAGTWVVFFSSLIYLVATGLAHLTWARQLHRGCQPIALAAALPGHLLIMAVSATILARGAASRVLSSGMDRTTASLITAGCLSTGLVVWLARYRRQVSAGVAATWSAPAHTRSPSSSRWIKWVWPVLVLLAALSFSSGVLLLERQPLPLISNRSSSTANRSLRASWQENAREPPGKPFSGRLLGGLCPVPAARGRMHIFGRTRSHRLLCAG